MAYKIVEFETETVAKSIANFTIGFLKLRVENGIEDATSLGSGTLVTIAGCHGVLTAAHVIEAFPERGEVGVVQFHELSARYQRLTINLEHTENLTIRSSNGEPNPDLGFLKLPQNSVEALNASAVFYNLDKRREDVLAGKEPAPNFASAAIGVVAERTIELPIDNARERLLRFAGFFADGELFELPDTKGFDYVQLTPLNRTEFPMPESFGGMSGGGLWKVYFEMVDDQPKVIDKRLAGVPFFQRREGESPPAILCHGAKSIHGRLFDDVRNRWNSVPAS